MASSNQGAAQVTNTPPLPSSLQSQPAFAQAHAVQPLGNALQLKLWHKHTCPEDPHVVGKQFGSQAPASSGGLPPQAPPMVFSQYCPGWQVASAPQAKLVPAPPVPPVATEPPAPLVPPVAPPLPPAELPPVAPAPPLLVPPDPSEPLEPHAARASEVTSPVSRGAINLRMTRRLARRGALSHQDA
jgi:hypothetical protein